MEMDNIAMSMPEIGDVLNRHEIEQLLRSVKAASASKVVPNYYLRRGGDELKKYTRKELARKIADFLVREDLIEFSERRDCDYVGDPDGAVRFTAKVGVVAPEPFLEIRRALRALDEKRLPPDLVGAE